MYLPQFTHIVYSVTLMSLGTGLISSCSQSHQVGMENNPKELLNSKLNHKDAVLTPEQSIILMNYCTDLGEKVAPSAANKDVTIFAGNTGAGKSTTLNALLGCNMQEVRARKLGIKGGGKKRVVIVAPNSPKAAVVPIGHGGSPKHFCQK